MILAEPAGYAIHRLMHRVPWLWRKTYTTLLHANLGWRLRGLERWIATPDYHALHHSHAPQHQDRNFAGMLPMLDRLFGTHAPLVR